MRARYEKMQKLFFSKVTESSNPSKVRLTFKEVTHDTAFSSFTGDGTRTTKLDANEAEKSYLLSCFYMRNVTDKQREKYGIDQDINTVIYISPLEMKRVMGTDTFPVEVRNSYSQIELSFFGKVEEIDSIIELEPLEMDGGIMCIAYQINVS